MSQEMFVLLEAFAMSGFLMIALYFLALCVVGGVIIVVLRAIFLDKKSSVLSVTSNDKDNKYLKLKSYYDPSYPKRVCANCSAVIKRGKVYCVECGKLDNETST
ncbi:TPA: hypothetical protein ACN311_004924 [Vibrio parahaemolyticus]